MLQKLRTGRIPETAYLIMLTVFIAAAFIEGTTLTHVFGVGQVMSLTYRIYQLTVLAVLVKIFFLDDSRLVTKAAILTALGLVYVICHRAQAMAPFFLAIFIFGAIGVDWSKILKCFFFTDLVLLIATVLAATFHAIPNPAQVRMYFGIPFQRLGMGIVTPTDLAAHAFSLMIAYALLKNFRFSRRQLLGLAVLTVAVFVLTDTRLDFMLMLLLLLSSAFYRDIRKFVTEAGPELFGILTGGVALLDLWITHVYYMPSRFWETVDRFMSSRLFYGNVAMKKCQVPPLLGRFIPQNGNGLMLRPGEQYFFIDSSVIRMWTMFGIVFTILMIMLTGFIIIRSFSAKYTALLVILLLIVLESTIDHHLWDLSYNILFVSAFADWSSLAYRSSC